MIGYGHSFDIWEEYGITLDLGHEIGFNNEWLSRESIEARLGSMEPGYAKYLTAVIDHRSGS